MARYRQEQLIAVTLCCLLVVGCGPRTATTKKTTGSEQAHRAPIKVSINQPEETLENEPTTHPPRGWLLNDDSSVEESPPAKKDQGVKLPEQQLPAGEANAGTGMQPGVEGMPTPSTQVVQEQAPAAQVEPQAQAQPQPVEIPPEADETIQRQRLARAKEIQRWSDILVEGTGIKCHMKSRWLDGRLQLRVALLGPRDQLTQFIDGTKNFTLKLIDAKGKPVLGYKIDAEEFQWSEQTDEPSLQFESSPHCPLVSYEACSNWKFTWQY